MTTYEIKAGSVDDPLEQSFATITDDLSVRVQKDDTATRPGLSCKGRPPLADMRGDQDVEHKAFVEAYLRKGQDLAPELKELTSEQNGSGGVAVPEILDRSVDHFLASASPLRGIVNVIQVGNGHYRRLVAKGGISSGWVSESAIRAMTDTPDFVEIAPPMGELYANPATSQTLLDDAGFDVESWLASEIAAEFARAESAAFVTGDGVNKPKGFLAYSLSDQGDATRDFNMLQYVPSGGTGDFAATNPEEALIDLVHSLDPGYRQGAVFVMNSTTLARIRKFRTSDGDMLWRPGLTAGTPATLLGYPVVEVEDMPDIAANAAAIAFGNFRLGYVVTQARATRILRDPYSRKPFVHFYATRRVGGGLMNGRAIKVLKF